MCRRCYVLTKQMQDLHIDVALPSEAHLRPHVRLFRRSLFIRDKPILSSEKMLRKDYDRKGSVEKENRLVVSL
jgi:hypothetical protein